MTRQIAKWEWKKMTKKYYYKYKICLVMTQTDSKIGLSVNGDSKDIS